MHSVQSQSGLSIIETVITLFIVGVALLIYAAASNNILLNSNAQHVNIAQRVALNELETLRAGGYASVPASGSFSDSLLTKLPSSSATITTSDYNASTKQIVVTVSWMEPSSKSNHSVTYTTLLTKFGL